MDVAISQKMEKRIDNLIKYVKENDRDVYIKISTTCDKRFIKACVERREKIGLNNQEVTHLIAQVYDFEYTKKCLDRKDELGLELKDELHMALETDKTRFYKGYIRKRYGEIKENDIDKYKDKKMKLPHNMTVGIEIETEEPQENDDLYDNNTILQSVVKIVEPGWDAGNDASLHNGTEVVSPIMHGDSRKDSDAIKGMCILLSRMGEITNEDCGGHIHIGADFLKSTQSWLNLIHIWTNNEKLIYILSNKENEISRENILAFASPYSRDLEEFMNEENQIPRWESMRSYFKRAQHGHRNYGMNLINAGTDGKNTIEFRLPNGTIEPNVWIDNINLFGGIVRVAEELATIQSKDKHRLTKDDKRKLELLEILKQKKVRQEDKLEALLELVITPEDRGIYRNRFKKNNALLNKKRIIKGAITRNVARRKIEINDIGKLIYLGKDALTGSEYEEVLKNIDRERRDKYEYLDNYEP